MIENKDFQSISINGPSKKIEKINTNGKCANDFLTNSGQSSKEESCYFLVKNGISSSDPNFINTAKNNLHFGHKNEIKCEVLHAESRKVAHI